MQTKIIIPILNKYAKFYRIPIWYLSDNVSIETISAEDNGIIQQSIPAPYLALLNKKTKCIRIENVDPLQSSTQAIVEGGKIAFLFNYFKSSHPIILAFAIELSKKRKIRFEKIIDLPVISDAIIERNTAYSIDTGVKRTTISNLYKVISKVYDNYNHILLTLNRFCSALYRKDPLDKIIDITISLESLINGKTELAHKFSAYNSWAVEPDPSKRKECYEMFKSLYNARSQIVHGSSMTQKERDKKIKPTIDNWADIITMAKQAIGYHLLYLYDHDIDSWFTHQESLVLGSAERIN